jgi:hypothetical protein
MLDGKSKKEVKKEIRIVTKEKKKLFLLILNPRFL